MMKKEVSMKDKTLDELVERKAKYEMILADEYKRLYARKQRCYPDSSLLDISLKELKVSYSLISDLSYLISECEVYMIYASRRYLCSIGIK